MSRPRATVRSGFAPGRRRRPDGVASAPEDAVERLASRLCVSTAALASYGERGQAGADHLGEVAEVLG